jgi:hypothetical protein
MTERLDVHRRSELDDILVLHETLSFIHSCHLDSGHLHAADILQLIRIDSSKKNQFCLSSLLEAIHVDATVDATNSKESKLEGFR